MTNAINYDILVGQQAFYPIGFGLDNLSPKVSHPSIPS